MRNHSAPPFYVAWADTDYSRPNYATPLAITAIIVLVAFAIYCMCEKPGARAKSCGACTSAKAAVPGHAEGKVLEVRDAAHLKELLASDHVVVVLFYAQWCGHCNEMKPEYHKAAEAHPDGLFAMADESVIGPEALREHQIEGFPSVRAYQHGQPKAEHTGARSAAAFVDFAKTSSK